MIPEPSNRRPRVALATPAALILILCALSGCALFRGGGSTGGDGNEVTQPPRDEARAARHFFPRLPAPFPVAPELPDDFRVAGLGEQPDILRGVAWGPKRALDELKRDRESPADRPEANGAYIIGRISPNVRQTDAGFNIEPTLRQSLTADGVRDIQIVQSAWGPYPALTASATQANGAPVELAWVGLNVDSGATLAFELRWFGANLTEAELRVWQNFLLKTRPMSWKEYFDIDALRFDGQTTRYRRNGARFEVKAESRVSDGKIALHIESVGEPVFVTPIQAGAFDWDGEEAVWLYARFEVKGDTESPRTVWVDTIPARPRESLTWTLRGRTLVENSRFRVTMVGEALELPPALVTGPEQRETTDGR